MYSEIYMMMQMKGERKGNLACSEFQKNLPKLQLFFLKMKERAENPIRLTRQNGGCEGA